MSVPMPYETCFHVTVEVANTLETFDLTRAEFAAFEQAHMDDDLVYHLSLKDVQHA